jgi:hypothetical protein
MVGRLQQIREGEAPAELAALYLDVRKELRLPFVPLLFRALAPHPGALRACWDQLRPNIATLPFEALADRLRIALAHAAVNLGTPLIEPVLASAGLDVNDTDEIREQVDLFHYADPKVLLCLTALDAGLESSSWPRVRHPSTRTFEAGAPLDTPELVLTSENPGGVAGELLDEIKRTLGLPVAEIELRALGHSPEFMDAAWREAGAPLFRHPNVTAELERVHEEALRLAKHLPYPVDRSRGLFAEEPPAMAAVSRVVATLRMPLLRLALLTAGLKVALDGAEDALMSSYSMETGPTPIDEIEPPS